MVNFSTTQTRASFNASCIGDDNEKGKSSLMSWKCPDHSLVVEYDPSFESGAAEDVGQPATCAWLIVKTSDRFEGAGRNVLESVARIASGQGDPI